eukprot:1506123-Pleurochrysis_carterae.AAC.1
MLESRPERVQKERGKAMRDRRHTERARSWRARPQRGCVGARVRAAHRVDRLRKRPRKRVAQQVLEQPEARSQFGLHRRLVGGAHRAARRARLQLRTLRALLRHGRRAEQVDHLNAQKLPKRWDWGGDQAAKKIRLLVICISSEIGRTSEKEGRKRNMTLLLNKGVPFSSGGVLCCSLAKHRPRSTRNASEACGEASASREWKVLRPESGRF